MELERIAALEARVDALMESVLLMSGLSKADAARIARERGLATTPRPANRPPQARGD